MFDVNSLLRDRDADWAFQPNKETWKLVWRGYGQMEAIIAHNELIAALQDAGELDVAEWAQGFRLEILGPLATEPGQAAWRREFIHPLQAGEGLGLILAEEQVLEQGMAFFSEETGMVIKRRTLIRLSRPAFYEDAGSEVWADGPAKAWI